MASKKIKTVIHTRRGDFNTIIWRDERDQSYLVKVPSLPSVVTFGKTLRDAKKMVKDAIELFCDCAIGEGKVIIDDKMRMIGKVPRSRVLSLA